MIFGITVIKTKKIDNLSSWISRFLSYWEHFVVYKLFEITKYKPHSYSVFPVNECFQELYFDKKFTLALYKKICTKDDSKSASHICE